MDMILKKTDCPECTTKLECKVTPREVGGEYELRIELDCACCGYWDALDVELEDMLREELGLPKGRTREHVVNGRRWVVL